jgi:DNA-directed RNA polymerase alpha subunit
MTEQLSHTEIGKEITVMDMPLDALGVFPARVINPLERDKITTIGALVGLTEQDFLRIPGLGRTALLDFKHKLYIKGLAFREPDKDGHPPLPFDSLHVRLSRIEQRLDSLERRAGKIT